MFLQKNVIIDALRYCQKHKGLEIYAYVLMHSHLHMLCKGVGSLTLAEIMRDFKKHASKKIIETLLNEAESRREWMLKYFSEACAHLKRPQRTGNAILLCNNTLSYAGSFLLGKVSKKYYYLCYR